MLQLQELLQQRQEIFYTPKRGFLRIFGKDCQSFVQRMSTGDMQKLSPKKPVGTCFITNKGKVVDLAVVFLWAADDIILVSSAPDNQHLYQWLSNFHFAEDLTFDGSFSGQCHIRVSPKVHELENAVFLGDFLYHGVHWLVSFVYGTAPGPSIHDDAWQTLRIMALLPEFPQEIHEHYMPDTINLEGFVADNKGCYIGQEVISKARLYQKHKKSLLGIQVSQDDWAKLKPQAIVLGPCKEACLVVSVAPFYLPDGVHALVVTDGTRADENTAFLGTVQAFVTKSLK